MLAPLLDCIIVEQHTVIQFLWSKEIKIPRFTEEC